MHKRIWNGAIVACLLMICVFSVFSTENVYGAGATLQDLQAKFPHNAYWNHVAQSGHRYVNYQDQGSCNNPDGYTWHPCYSHSADAPIGGYDCNSFQNAVQCCGFAKKLAYDVYGSTHSSWGQTSVSNAKPGDVIHYYGGGADATWGHWAMIIAKNGNTLTFGEAGVGANCKISWGRTLSVSSMSSYVIYSAPYQLPIKADVTYSNVKYENVTATSVKILADVKNPARYTVTEVGSKLWDSKGNLLYEGQNAITPYNDISGWQSINYSNLHTGTTYYHQFYLIADGNAYYSEKQQFAMSVLYGDVDLNGEVNASDALDVLKAVVKLNTLTNEQFTAAEVDASGDVSATDALFILRKVVRLIDKFPVEK